MSAREYAKQAPSFWTGETGREIKRRGFQATIVALYLISSPHSNMIGLYYQPLLYMAEETGLDIEGASKGLQGCIEAGFCAYDDSTKMVWVFEMAAYQIGRSLSSGDKRCKGIQKDYDRLPRCPFLEPFFDRYADAFHLTQKRGFEPDLFTLPARGIARGLVPKLEAPSKPGAGAGAGAGAEPKRASPSISKTLVRGFEDWFAATKAAGERPIPDGDPIFAYAEGVNLPRDFLHLAWLEFKFRYSQPEAKKYKDWRAVFRKAVRENWLKLWWLDGEEYALTTAGKQAQMNHKPRGDA